MNIIQYPSAIVFSRNIPDIMIDAVGEVTFELKLDGQTVVSESYVPGSNGRIFIRLKDVVESFLHTDCRTLLGTFTQYDAKKTFRTVFTESGRSEERTFTAVKGGIANLPYSDSANFMRTHFLTHQPREKRVLFSSPEQLTYFAQSNAVIKAKSNQTTVTLYTLAADTVTTFATQYNILAGKFEHPAPVIDVWAEDEQGNQLTYIQRYILSEAPAEPQFFLFENSVGGVDGFFTEGRMTLESKHEHKLSEVDELAEEYDVDTDRTYNLSTGFLNDAERKWLLDFFPSRTKLFYTPEGMVRIVLTSDKASYTTADPVSGYSFSFRRAADSDLLAEQQTANIAMLSLGMSAEEDIPATLAEAPAAILEDGTLLPAQHPYASRFNRTSVGALADYLLGKLTDADNSVQSKFLGYFTSSSALRAVRDIPSPGDSAWVGPTFPGTVWIENNGFWMDTNAAPNPDSIALNSTERVVAFDDLNTLNDVMRSPGVYLVQKSARMNRMYTVGILLVISDDMGHGVHQFLYTRAKVNPDGTSSAHTDRKTYIYERAYHNSTSSTPAEMHDKWTPWQSLTLAYFDENGVPYLYDAAGEKADRIITESYLRTFLNN